MTTRARVLLFLIASGVAVPFLYLGAKVAVRGYREYTAWQGVRLNRQAWEAGFLERGQAVPEAGPRDGYWGARIGVQIRHPELGWILPELHYTGLLETDAMGVQRVGDPDAPTHLLIMGASTAFGGYASTIDTTYFSQLRKALASHGVPVRISVFATGAWKSVQELKGLEIHGVSLEPDVVLFLNGLNDVTNGSNAKTLYGIETATLDGSRWHPLYNERDYEERVREYLANMAAAADLLRSRGIGTVFALQPALFEKKTLSALEQTLEDNSLQFLGTRRELQATYDAMRRGLRSLADRTGSGFIDATRVFNREQATVFTDVWHFSDPGHRILAEALADGLASRLGGTP